MVRICQNLHLHSFTVPLLIAVPLEQAVFGVCAALGGFLALRPVLNQNQLIGNTSTVQALGACPMIHSCIIIAVVTLPALSNPTTFIYFLNCYD